MVDRRLVSPATMASEGRLIFELKQITMAAVRVPRKAGSGQVAGLSIHTNV